MHHITRRWGPGRSQNPQKAVMSWSTRILVALVLTASTWALAHLLLPTRPAVSQAASRLVEAEALVQDQATSSGIPR